MIIEVDGVIVEFDNIIEIGAVHGTTDITKKDDAVASYQVSQECFWRLHAEKHPGGVDGYYKHGEWKTAQDGSSLYRVWDRIT